MVGCLQKTNAKRNGKKQNNPGWEVMTVLTPVLCAQLNYDSSIFDTRLEDLTWSAQNT